MKRILWKALTCILIVMLVTNFTYAAFQNRVYAGVGDLLSNILGGLVGLITWIPRALIMAVAIGFNSLVTALAVAGGGSITETVNGRDDFFVTPFHIFFNKIELLNVNFFDFEVEGTALIFREAVAGWYYAIRTIASMILLVILIYVGIKMAISTIASEKAMYKKMLVDWTCSLALLFLLHYIMLFTFECNDALVAAMEQLGVDTDMTSFMSNLTSMAFGLDTVAGFTAIIIYSILVFQTLSFLIAYMKRMITVGFLVMIAPLITVTYSIDKMGDQKAQALNTWLKEFVYNILIQPFHCILFLSFGNIAYQLIDNPAKFGNPFTVIGAIFDTSASNWTNLTQAMLAILCIQFIKEGEKMVRKIFGFGDFGSAANMAANTAIAMGALTKGGQMAGKAGGAAAKGVNAIKTNEKVQDLTKAVKRNTKAVGSAVAKAGGKVGGAVAGAAGKAGTAVSSKVSSMKEKHKENSARKAAIKDDEKAIERATQKLRQKGVTRPPSEEEIETEKKSMTAARVAKAQRKEETKQKVSKAATWTKEKASGAKAGAKAGIKWAGNTSLGKGAKFVGKKAATATKMTAGAVGSLASEAAAYASQNKDKIIGAGVGLVTGSMGLAGGGGAGAIAGLSTGSSFVRGYMANSTKTASKDVNQYLQNLQNLTGAQNSESAMYGAVVEGKNDGFKDLHKELQALMQTLQRCGISTQADRSTFTNDLARNMMTGEVTQEGLRESLLAYGVGEDKIDEALEATSQYGSRLAAQGVYNSVSTLQSTNGMELADVAKMIGNKDPHGMVETIETETHEETNTHEETETREQQTQEFAQNEPEANGQFDFDYSRIEQIIQNANRGDDGAVDEIKRECSRLMDEIRRVNSSIQSNNDAIRQLESENQSGQNTILSALQSAGKIGTSATTQQVVQVLKMGDTSNAQPTNNS